MIPNMSCHKEANVIVLGAIILNKLKKTELMSLEDLILLFSNKKKKISVDHIILTCDWLYAINAIDYNKNGVWINASN